MSLQPPIPAELSITPMPSTIANRPSAAIVNSPWTATTRNRCVINSGTCHELLRGEVSLFLFAFVDGVEPTSDAAERALRQGCSGGN